MGTISKEREATNLQDRIKTFLGRPATKKEALKALQLHVDGDGGNTVGWQFAEPNTTTHSEDTFLGDALIDLGRLASENPELKWCFPESYRAYHERKQKEDIK